MAVQGTNGTMLSEQDSQHPATESSSVFVNGLAPEVTSDTFKEVFGKVGKVASAVVMRDQFGASRGFGFVNYSKPEEAERAIQQFNKVPHRAGTWLVRKAEKRKPDLKNGQVADGGLDLCNLFIRGLEPEVTSIRLQSMFEEFGKVVSSKILVDPRTGASKCTGFLRFSAPEEAARAIHEMNGKQVGSKKLFVTMAQKRTNLEVPGFAQHPPPYEQNAAQPGTPTGMAYFVPVPGMGAPHYSHVPYAPKAGQSQQPAFQPYGMPQPGLVPMHPQAFPPGYMPPQMYWPGVPMAAYPGMQPGYQQQLDPRMLSRQQQAQQFYMMTSGQDGTYFDMASNSFMHSGRGYRMHQAGRGPPGPAAAGAAARGRRGRQLFPDPPMPSPNSQARPPAKAPPVVNPKAPVKQDAAPVNAPAAVHVTVPKDTPVRTKEILAKLAITPNKHLRISMMGDALFTAVQALHPEKDSAKVTGMLLEMTEPEILRILEDPDALAKKVDEALGVLKAAGYKGALPIATKAPKESPGAPATAPEEPKTADVSNAAESSVPSDMMEKLSVAEQ